MRDKKLNQKSNIRKTIINRIIFASIYLIVLIISLFLTGELRINPWMANIISFFPEKIIFYLGLIFYYIFIFPTSFVSQVYINFFWNLSVKNPLYPANNYSVSLIICNAILLFIYMYCLHYVIKMTKKLNQKNIKYFISLILIVIVVSACWLIFSKQFLKSQNPVKNTDSSKTIETVGFKILEDPVFRYSLEYPDNWDTSVTQIVKLGSKNNRSWLTTTFQTRSKNNMSIPDGIINVYIGKTNKTLFKNIFKDLSPGYASYTSSKEQSLIIDNQPARQINYSNGEEPLNPATTTVIYYPDDVYLQITFFSTDKNAQLRYFPIYNDTLTSLHRDSTSKSLSNPFSTFVDDIKKRGLLPKQWDGATISINIMAKDLYQVIVEYNNILGKNESYLSYFEYWTNNRTGNWELLGRYSSGQQGLSTCEDWESLKVAKGMECSRWINGKWDFNNKVIIDWIPVFTRMTG